MLKQLKAKIFHNLNADYRILYNLIIKKKKKYLGLKLRFTYRPTYLQACNVPNLVAAVHTPHASVIV